MKNRRVASLAAVGAAAALALAACGGSGGGGSSSPTGSSSGGFNAAAESIIRPTSTPTGGTLKLGASGDCDSYDPARTYYAWCWDMQRLFTRSVLGFASKPGAAGTEVVPDLAAAMPEVSSDGLTWTAKLQSGLKWDDGTPLTTKDVKYGIERLYATRRDQRWPVVVLPVPAGHL